MDRVCTFPGSPQADENVALGLIGVYRGVGGGWEYRPSAMAPLVGAALGTPIAADAPLGVLP